MLNKRQLYAALHRTKPVMGRTLAQSQSRAQRIAAGVHALRHLTHAETGARLDELDENWPGARPTADVDAHPGFCVPFPLRWPHKKAAQAWAHEVLKTRPTVAVDGSQLVSERGMSIAVGAIQIGYYYNDPLLRDHGKGQDLELIMPDVSEWDAARQGEELSREVNRLRFQRECQKIPQLAQSLSAAPVCFYDNSFLVSFAQRLKEDAPAYIAAAETLLRESRARGFPVVGYVDTSDSRDLGHMLAALDPEGGGPFVRDAALLHELLPNWGDRTPFMQCARADGLSLGQDLSFYYAEVGFVYMRTDPRAHPSRLEIPMWAYEAGHLESILNAVRAECLYGGSNYPNALSLADKQAVLTQRDRAVFYESLKLFAKNELGLNLYRSAKANNKRMTR